MCDKYWELRQYIEVTCGPKSLLTKLRGDSSENDLAIYWREANNDVFKVALPGFSARAVLLGGLPHISPEDIVLSLPLNENYLGSLIISCEEVEEDSEEYSSADDADPSEERDTCGAKRNL